MPVCLLSPQPPDKPHHPQQHAPANTPAKQVNDFTKLLDFLQNLQHKTDRLLFFGFKTSSYGAANDKTHTF